MTLWLCTIDRIFHSTSDCPLPCLMHLTLGYTWENNTGSHSMLSTESTQKEPRECSPPWQFWVIWYSNIMYSGIYSCPRPWTVYLNQPLKVGDSKFATPEQFWLSTCMKWRAPPLNTGFGHQNSIPALVQLPGRHRPCGIPLALSFCFLMYPTDKTSTVIRAITDSKKFWNKYEFSNSSAMSAAV